MRKRSALDRADIVFLDPDNGVGDETEKHATFGDALIPVPTAQRWLILHR